MQDLKSLVMTWATVVLTTKGPSMARVPGGVDVPRRQGEGLAIVSVGTGDVL
jgi:hypothetical protein